MPADAVKEIDWAALAADLKARSQMVRHEENAQATPVTHTAHLAASIVLEQIAEAVAKAVK
jgi:hypothetical protein